MENKENALWHKVTEQEKEEIKKNAKKIMDEFASKLDKIKIEKEKQEHFQSGDGLREEGDPWSTDKEFRDTTFCNAPDVDGDFISAEKGGWK